MQFYAILGFLMEKHHLKNAKKIKQSLSADVKFFGNLKERRDFRKAVLAYLKNTKDDKLQFKANLYDRCGQFKLSALYKTIDLMGKMFSSCSIRSSTP